MGTSVPSPMHRLPHERCGHPQHRKRLILVRGCHPCERLAAQMGPTSGPTSYRPNKIPGWRR